MNSNHRCVLTFYDKTSIAFNVDGREYEYDCYLPWVIEKAVRMARRAPFRALGYVKRWSECVSGSVCWSVGR